MTLLFLHVSSAKPHKTTLCTHAENPLSTVSVRALDWSGEEKQKILAQLANSRKQRERFQRRLDIARGRRPFSSRERVGLVAGALFRVSLVPSAYAPTSHSNLFGVSLYF